jgi:hypothetical protein
MPATRLAAWTLVTAAAAAGLAAAPALAIPWTAAQIVENNAAARGGAVAWRRIETLAWTGHVESAGRSGRAVPFLLEQKRPDRTRFEVTVDGQKAIRGFDGAAGWKLRLGSAGRPELQSFTGDELRFARGAAGIGGPLMEQAAGGAAVSLAGLQEIEGRRAYALDLRLPSGGASKIWVDAETFLELRYDREFVNAQGRTAVSSVVFGDYRAVEGLQVPFSVRTGTPDGRSRDTLRIERVVLNPRLSDRAFAKPGSAVAPHRGVVVDTRSASRAGPARPEP